MARNGRGISKEPGIRRIITYNSTERGHRSVILRRQMNIYTLMQINLQVDKISLNKAK